MPRPLCAGFWCSRAIRVSKEKGGFVRNSNAFSSGQFYKKQKSSRCAKHLAHHERNEVPTNKSYTEPLRVRFARDAWHKIEHRCRYCKRYERGPGRNCGHEIGDSPQIGKEQESCADLRREMPRPAI